MIGDFIQGLSGALSTHVTSERENARKQEDQQLAEQMDLIKALISRPDINPALVGRALTDLTTLGAAKGSKRKSKGGKAGFLGATELPLSQLLQGIQAGTTPMMGNTTEVVPEPPVPTQVAGYGPAQFQITPPQPKDINFDYNGIGVHAPFTGESALESPVLVPPPGTPTPRDSKRLVSAAQDVQAHNTLRATQGTPRPRRPVAKQPLLRAPEEMATERGAAEAAQYKGRRTGQQQADVEILRGLGASDEQIREAMLRDMMGSSGSYRPIPLQSQNWVAADGTPFSVMWNPDPSAPIRYYDEAGQPMDPTIVATKMVGGRRIGVGPIVQWNVQTDDFGNVSTFAMDRNTPRLLGGGIPAPPGVQGRTSPAGPVVTFAGPLGNQMGRMTRTGSDVMPGSVGGGSSPLLQASSATETTAQVANMTALQMLQRMRSLYRPELVGPAAGRWSTAMTMLPDVPGVDVPGMQIPEGWSDFQPVVTQFTNTMIKAITGAQMSEPEATRIKAQLPQVNDLPVMFESKIQQSLNNIGDIARAYIAKGRPVPQELLDAARAFGIQIPEAAPTQGNNTTVPDPPSMGAPGQGVQLRHKTTGQVGWIVDPAMVDYALRNGDFERVQ